MRRACSSEVRVGESPFAVAVSLAPPRGRQTRRVQAETIDLARDLARNEVVDLLTAPDSIPDLARGDRPRRDLDDTHTFGLRMAGACGHRDACKPPHLVRLLPRLERSPLVGAENEDRVFELGVAQEVDRVRVAVETNVAEAPERELGEPQARLRVGHHFLVAGALGHKHQHLAGAQTERTLGERDMTNVRRVEDAAEDRDAHERIRVSSPTSTSEPVFAPAARSASSSSAWSGADPTTRKPRSVRKILNAPRASGRGRSTR